MHARRGEPAAVATDIHGEARFGGKERPAHVTTLYPSAQARPSSVTLQCCSGMPPPLEKNS